MINQKNESIRKKKKVIFRRTLLLFLFFFAIITASVLTIYQADEILDIGEQKTQAENIVTVKLENIQTEMSHVTTDLMILSLNSQLLKFWDDTTNTEIMTSISQEFLTTAIYRKIYDQVRLINDDGQELIRINYNNGYPAAVAKHNLQNKKDRYYFQDAIKLNKNEIFASQLDLNIEHGQIEQPLKPMIRIATPVFDKKGKKRGIVLFNYFGENIINMLIHKDSLAKNQLMLLNSDGYWLKGPSPDLEWGFMYKDHKDITFDKYYPNVWEIIKNNEASQFETDLGLFTFKTIYPLLNKQKYPATENFTLKTKDASLKKAYAWKLVYYIPAAVLYSKHKEYRQQAGIIITILFIVMLIFATRYAKIEYHKLHAEISLKKSEANLKEAVAAKDKFFSILAHDLKAPFNSMLAFSTILNEQFDKYDSEKQKKFIGMIYTSIQNTYKLLESILLWSRSQRGTIDFKPKKINLFLLTNETYELLQHSAENKSITLTKRIPENIFIEADKDMLSTTLRNLLSNAIKFTPKNGKISVTAHLIKDANNIPFVEVIVKDSGIGISQEVQAELFDISTQTITEGTDNESGTGFGLILCKEFVEKHGGKIWLKSEVGKGSDFTFTIPLKSDITTI
ncbi:sensor histidine kinase [Geofilum sp. OHC36d9]|uniref:sensor histidine kinase n=1 Tax=Geofilum sp. OHC36d9 TaxID=3458413 RepID=UPI0040343CF5